MAVLLLHQSQPALRHWQYVLVVMNREVIDQNALEPLIHDLPASIGELVAPGGASGLAGSLAVNCSNVLALSRPLSSHKWLIGLPSWIALPSCRYTRLLRQLHIYSCLRVGGSAVRPCGYCCRQV